MSRIKLPGCALLLLVLAGCSWVQPFVDRRRNAGAEEGKLYVGQSRPEAPVVWKFKCVKKEEAERTDQ